MNLNNKQKGDLYEKYILKKICQNNECWLWKDIPQQILIECGFFKDQEDYRIKKKLSKQNNDEDLNFLIDTGFDLIEKDINNNYNAIQCKNGYKNGLTFTDISTFIAMKHCYKNIKFGKVYYTSKINNNIKRICLNTDDLIFINEPFEDFNIDLTKENKIKLYSHQKEAIKKINKNFNKENRSILSIPCGAGKTLISFKVSENYDTIIFISPLKQFAEQTIYKFKEFYNTHKTLLIDSDGVRDNEKIKKFMKENNKIFLSVTYKSVDIISKILNKLNNPIFIIDEFHNLTLNNLINTEDPINKLLKSKNKILFLSATPRIYEIENSEYDEEYFNDLLGNITYKMDFGFAIKNKIICDYNIYVPSISISNKQMINDIGNEINIEKIEDEYIAKSIFLFKCLTLYGSKKIIIFCKDSIDLKNLKSALEIIKEYYFIDNIYIDEITNKTKQGSVNNKNSREFKINKFSDFDGISLLLSIKILDECVDIPCCDSVYISYPTESKIRNIQRICRSVRIDKYNPYKKAKIYIWCNEYKEILEFLSSLKEYDTELIKKIKVEDVYLNKVPNNNQFIENDNLLINNYIVGIKEFSIQSWNYKFEQLKKYLELYKKKPSYNDPDLNIASLSRWLTAQHKYFKEKIYNFKNENNYKAWEYFIEKYKDYIKTYDDIWEISFNLLKRFINNKKRKPIRKKIINKQCKDDNDDNDDNDNNDDNDDNNDDNDDNNDDNDDNNDDNDDNDDNDETREIDEIVNIEEFDNFDKIESYLAKWVQRQNYSLKNKKNIRSDKWFEFIKKNEEIFKSNIDIWIDNLEKVKNYLIKNNKRPNTHEKLGKWISHQIDDYKNKKRLVYNNKKIKKIWEEFYDNNITYFISNDEIWYNNYKKLVDFIEINKRKPKESIEEEAFLAKWIDTQNNINYKNKDLNRIMFTNKKICETWENFLIKYSIYFKNYKILEKILNK